MDFGMKSRLVLATPLQTDQDLVRRWSDGAVAEGDDLEQNLPAGASGLIRSDHNVGERAPGQSQSLVVKNLDHHILKVLASGAGLVQQRGGLIELFHKGEVVIRDFACTAAASRGGCRIRQAPGK